MKPLRLGVNVDHVATVRNARGGALPDPVRAALLAIDAGADGITAHLREDRRHIRDEDMRRLKASIGKPLNFEMAATDQMLDIALRTRPHACCLVPEKRTERTTEGGLDVVGGRDRVGPCIGALQKAGIEVSLFIDPDPEQIDLSAALGARVIEMHTGAYSNAYHGCGRAREFRRLADGAVRASGLGLKVNAGHGINYVNIAEVRTLPHLNELNIGHSILSRAVFNGIDEAVREMKRLMNP